MPLTDLYVKLQNAGDPPFLFTKAPASAAGWLMRKAYRQHRLPACH
jgi:hypothetical protein